MVYIFVWFLWTYLHQALRFGIFLNVFVDMLSMTSLALTQSRGCSDRTNTKEYCQRASYRKYRSTAKMSWSRYWNQHCTARCDRSFCLIHWEPVISALFMYFSLCPIASFVHVWEGLSEDDDWQGGEFVLPTRGSCGTSVCSGKHSPQVTFVETWGGGVLSQTGRQWCFCVLR